MSKKARRAKNSRDAPKQREAGGMVFLSDPESYKILCGDGYRPIASCPEVQMCISAYAEAIANMTMHLMINTEKGDKRIRALAKQVRARMPAGSIFLRGYEANLIAICPGKAETDVRGEVEDAKTQIAALKAWKIKRDETSRKGE